MENGSNKRFITISVLVLMVAIVFYSAVVSAKEPSKNEAIEVIQPHIDKIYMQIPLTFESIYITDNMSERIKQLENLEIIKTVLEYGSSRGEKNRSFTFNHSFIGDGFRVITTNKGEQISNFLTIDGKIAFHLYSRKIEEVFQIDKEDNQSYTIYFSYITTPSLLAKILELREDAFKLKGKASVKYDLFTKKFIFQNMWFSTWDTLEWKPTYWISFEDGKKIFKIAEN